MPPLNQRNDRFWNLHVEPSQKETFVKKSVSFASGTNQEYPVLNRANYSPIELKNSWYAKPDFVEFALDIRYTVEIIERGDSQQLLDDVNFTTRGSICRKECTARKRKQFRDGAKDCVLRAQDQSQCNAEYISSVYTQYSQASVQEALKKANEDHHEAKLVHSHPVPVFWDKYFSDAWITHLEEDGSPPAKATTHYEAPPNLLDDDSFMATATDGFDDSWLVGPVA